MKTIHQQKKPQKKKSHPSTVGESDRVTYEEFVRGLTKTSKLSATQLHVPAFQLLDLLLIHQVKSSHQSVQTL